jgi:hypothetical protein
MIERNVGLSPFTEKSYYYGTNMPENLAGSAELRRSAKAVQTIQRVRDTDYAAFRLSLSASPASPRSQEGVAAEP